VLHHGRNMFYGLHLAVWLFRNLVSKLEIISIMAKR